MESTPRRLPAISDGVRVLRTVGAPEYSTASSTSCAPGSAVAAATAPTRSRSSWTPRPSGPPRRSASRHAGGTTPNGPTAGNVTSPVTWAVAGKRGGGDDGSSGPGRCGCRCGRGRCACWAVRWEFVGLWVARSWWWGGYVSGASAWRWSGGACGCFLGVGPCSRWLGGGSAGRVSVNACSARAAGEWGLTSVGGRDETGSGGGGGCGRRVDRGWGGGLRDGGSRCAVQAVSDSHG